jgi:hypothetical protein
MTKPHGSDASEEDLDWDLVPSSSASGVVPASTVRPEFDMSTYARESEERLAIASFIPTTPAPPGAVTETAVPKTKEPSPELRALAHRARGR